MVHVPEPLYFYRIREDSGNTYLVRNAEIQRVQQEVGNKYFYQLIDEETRRRQLERIDLGGFHNPPTGYDVLDIRPGPGIKVCDVTQGLPYGDDSVGIIRAVDFLEHIKPDDVIPLMNEIWRVLAPNGFLISSTPSTEGKGAFCDPTHVSFWNDLSFRYYCNPDFAKFVPEFTGRFQATRVWTNFPSDWHKENNVPYVHADLMKVI
jgi:SAM-dependent methyltransferase